MKCLSHRMIVILFSVLCNHGLILKLHQEKNSHLIERWLFIGRLKVQSLPGMGKKE